MLRPARASGEPKFARTGSTTHELPVQLRIPPAQRDEFLVGAALDDFAGAQDQDAVGVPDGRQTVSDNKTGPPLEQLLQRLLNARFGLRIDGAGGLVEYQDARLARVKQISCRSPALKLLPRSPTFVW
jgi:hypothetical protein